MTAYLDVSRSECRQSFADHFLCFYFYVKVNVWKFCFCLMQSVCQGLTGRSLTKVVMYCRVGAINDF